MARGEKSKWSLISFTKNISSYLDYSNNVNKDIKQLKEHYPFISEVIIPYSNPYSTRVFEIYLINKDTVEKLFLKKDFIDKKHSETKALLVIPFNYKVEGAKIILGKKICLDQVPEKHIHINGYFNDGYELCAGVPESFINLDNVLLENCKTAENYIIQITSYINKETCEINMIEYSHGDKGRIEYGRKQKKYKIK